MLTLTSTLTANRIPFSFSSLVPLVHRVIVRSSCGKGKGGWGNDPVVVQ
jgi:hypothetical protein